MCNTKLNAKKFKHKWEETTIVNTQSYEMLFRDRPGYSHTHVKSSQETKCYSSWMSGILSIRPPSTTSRVNAFLSGLNYVGINPP